ncbi:MAG: tRNA (adenosine(37)-N6)-threonylcarbamoyltransferase complex ATPase subunit type 1 TsaE [Bacteroides sp.]|jgi:tRNA threonylcarbamoyladenosine biosynthesis protein TsaE|nr:tRNA (adenosine(37)-N6)-threonylcarbamoyltransferase complex ATPase subunit type 1 TsaE [Bacteroides sp.]
MVTTEILTAKDPAALDEVAKTLLSAFPAGRIFAFYGPMGVGKTTLIKALCRQLGTVDVVSSPTFSIINQYMTDSGESIFHFDFYRIKDIVEVYNLGYEDYFFSGSYCFIEWPEKIEALLPEGSHVVIMEDHHGERIIRF